MILLVIIAVAIWRRAEKIGLIHYVWVLITAGFYLLIPFLVGIVLAFFDSSILYHEWQLTMLSLGSSFAGVGISWLILENVAKKKKEKVVTKHNDRNILDDEYLENL